MCLGLLIIVLGGIAVMNMNKQGQEAQIDAKGEELIEYFESFNGIRIRDISIAAQGYVKPQGETDEYAYICIEIDKNSIDTAKQRFSDAGIEEGNGKVYLPAAHIHEVARKIQDEETVTWYNVFRNGILADTRNSRFFITKDSSGRAFVYMFG